MELLLGCGRARDKRIALPGTPDSFTALTTLDWNADHEPDIVHDLEQIPLPFADNTFDEIHAYEVLEHTGAQGDWRFFFAQFSDFWRILKAGGLFCATVPMWNTLWAWGDPSHKRIINEGTLMFLSQSEYAKQIGKTPMSDFRFVYKADFAILAADNKNGTFGFVLRAEKYG